MRVLAILMALHCSMAFGQVETMEGMRPINGTKLYFKVFGKAPKTAKGEPLIFLHGGPGLNHSYFLPHLKKLNKYYALIFFDQRACGQSAIPGSDSVSLRFSVEDIEAIRQHFSLEKVTLFAHSWGAIPAVKYASAYPDRVKGIIFCNPVALSKEYDPITAENAASKITSRDSTNRSIIIGSPDFKAGKADAYRRLLMQTFKPSFAIADNLEKLNLELPTTFKKSSGVLMGGLSAELAQYNFYSELQRFKFPVLILHGRADIIPLAASEEMLQNIPNSRLTIFRSSGHFVFIEEPKKFAQEVFAFGRMLK